MNRKEYDTPKGKAVFDYDGNGVGRITLECMDMLMDMVASSMWIPCIERLPNERGEYLVTYHPCYWDRVEDDIKVGIDTFRGKTAWAKKKYQKVIAWQPLPEPWEGADNEGVR